MATLYELTEEYRQLLEMMEDDTVDPEVLQDTCESEKNKFSYMGKCVVTR